MRLLLLQDNIITQQRENNFRVTKVPQYKHFGQGTDSLIARKELRARATLGSIAAEKGEHAHQCRGFYHEVYGGGHRSRGFILQGREREGGGEWMCSPSD